MEDPAIPEETEEERTLRALQGILRLRHISWNPGVYVETSDMQSIVVWPYFREPTISSVSHQEFMQAVRQQPDAWEIL